MNAGIIKKSLSIGSDQVEYICGNGAIDEENYEGIFIVSDVIMKLYPDKIGKLPEENTILVGDGEQSKLIGNYEKVCRMLIERNVERGSYITYIGGGTVGDLVGFMHLYLAKSCIFEAGVSKGCQQEPFQYLVP